MRGDQFGADGHGAFARRAAEGAAGLLPQREEAAREECRVIEHRDVDGARAAAHRIVAANDATSVPLASA